MKKLILCAVLGSFGCSDDLSPSPPPTYKSGTDDGTVDQGEDSIAGTDPEIDRIPSTSIDTTINPESGTLENEAEPNTPLPDTTTPEKPGTVDTTSPVLTPSIGRSLALPIGIENANDSPMKLATTQSLLRFVPRQTMTIDRFYFGFKLQGADCDPGTLASGAGNGGILNASLVAIDPSSGLPGAVIVSESINACERFNEAYAELQNKSVPTVVWINAKASLEANKVYGFIIRNSDQTPDANFFSFTMPVADTILAGPHAKNNLDANAKGAILSMDPREAVAWSADSGKTWKFGSENGPYLAYMNNSDKLHPATRVPQYGFRMSGGANVADQPYSASGDDCSGCSTTYANASSKLSLTQLGGYTSSSTNVGTLTITHSRTASTASCTPAQGYGFRTCKLSAAFIIEKGDSYSIRASGSVEVLRLDNSLESLFPDVGTSSGEFRMFQALPSAGTKARDVPQIWTVE